MPNLLDKYAEIGHVILRVDLGFASLFLRNIWQLAGGPERGRRRGRDGVFQITFAPVFWGLADSLAEAQVTHGPKSQPTTSGLVNV